MQGQRGVTGSHLGLWDILERKVVVWGRGRYGRKELSPL